MRVGGGSGSVRTGAGVDHILGRVEVLRQSHAVALVVPVRAVAAAVADSPPVDASFTVGANVLLRPAPI